MSVTSEQKKKKRQWRKRVSAKRVCLNLFLASIILLSLFFTHEINIFLKFQYDYSSFAIGTYEVHFVDVGQGDATLIRFTNGKTMLVDSGDERARDNLTNYIDNVFFRKGKKIFNYVVLTHGDSDHMGNMAHILDRYAVEVFYAPMQEDGTKKYLSLTQKLKEQESKNSILLKYNFAGMEIVEGEEKVTWLNPTRETYSSTNDFSPIMLVELIDCSILLTGDATSAVGEIEAINYFVENVDVDILKLGHHGSNTSTSLQFLETFTPEIAVISCALYNKYNHPSPATLERLAQYDQMYNKNLSNYLSTAQKGNIIFHIDNNGELSTSLLDNVNNYTFISWVYIALPASITLIVVAFVPVKIKREEWKKLQNKIRKNKKI